jgi:hypothetical protein
MVLMSTPFGDIAGSVLGIESASRPGSRPDAARLHHRERGVLAPMRRHPTRWQDLDHRWDCPCSHALWDLTLAADRDDETVNLVSDDARQDPRPLDERPHVRLVLPCGQMVGAWRVLAVLLQRGQLVEATADLTDHEPNNPNDGASGGTHLLSIGLRE